jgi:hypothetical protein
VRGFLARTFLGCAELVENLCRAALAISRVAKFSPVLRDSIRRFQAGELAEGYRLLEENEDKLNDNFAQLVREALK